MQYANAKIAADIKLDGITVAFDKVDNALQAVYFRDAKGNRCRVVLSSYSMSAQVPAPPKKEKRYVVRGELPVLGKIEKSFAENYEANNAKSELEPLASGVTFTITCEEVEIVEDAPVSAPDEIPF